MRIALGIEYCGHRYNGWQTQGHHDLPTLQTSVEKAISVVADHPVKVICAGRTDKGVHAFEQVVHFETDAVREDHSWLLGINSNLPNDIAIKWVKFVDDDFHARFSATSRRYHYYIYNNKARPAILSNRITWHSYPLDIDKMQEAAAALIGEHDFSAFRAAHCQSKSSHRHVELLQISRSEQVVCCTIEANAFLHHMVRNIVGSLFEIGGGRKSVTWMKELLDAKDRDQAGATAPADGLYLAKVRYPERFGLDNSASMILFNAL